MKFKKSLSFARSLDHRDPLRRCRKLFIRPRGIYFVGNSLGLQPRHTIDSLKKELRDWARLGVHGHLKARRPWMKYHVLAKKTLARLCGASNQEVIAMNHLTVNLHLMIASFYTPGPLRYKVLVERGAFPSDLYAVESQIRFHGFDPREALVEVAPGKGEDLLHQADIIRAINEHGDQLALVLFPGIQYYTGQRFDIATITKEAHRVGALAGFDLAHAIGNVPLHLHNDQVDFAVWCSYKYLNSGPGGVGGAFVHERHHLDKERPRLAGWWGHDENERFLMKKGFKPMADVDGWQVSNQDVLSGAAHLAALEPFQKVAIKALRRKSLLLTGYLEFLLGRSHPAYHIITPADPQERGCQLSIYMNRDGKKVFNGLARAGIIADWREPDVIRVAPVPLYNTFEEVYRFAVVFTRLVEGDKTI